MKFSYNWLKKYVDIKLSPEKLAELLTLYSFETNVSGKIGNDTILDVDILPNRAHDCFSYCGLAKEIGVLTKKPLKKINVNFKTDNLKLNDFVSVEVKERDSCPRYKAKVLTDIKIERSPEWLQDELIKFNIKPHNNIVDILNYVMLETGQPMHAFDCDKLEMKKIIVRKARKNEKINTLDGGKYHLDENILVIADGQKPVAIAGIKGGLETGVSEKTKRIVIESANFEPSGIRKTDRILGLNTDAAIRFSYGIDPNLAEFGLNRVCALIQEIAPGVKIASSSIDVYPKKNLPKTIKLNLEYLKSLIGENIKPEFVRKTLESLGAKIKVVGKSQFLVTVPTIRLDLETEEDLIEEVARIYGYVNLKSILPIGALAFPKINDANLFSNKIRDVLAGVGFSEVYNYSFIGEKDAKGIDENKVKELIEIQNPASEDFKYLRPNLVLNLLKNVKNNFRFFSARGGSAFGGEKVKFFEIGKIFFSKKGFFEKFSLAGVYAVKENKELTPGKRFLEIKGDLDVLFEKLGITDYWYDAVALNKWWHPGRVAYIKHNENLVGIIGEVSPETLAAYGISGRVAMFNVDFEKLIEIAQEEREFSPISKYPAVVRDIAILVNRETRVREVLNVIYGAGVDLVEDADLFDYYEGEGMPEGKRSLAFHIVYQADRTLTDEEVRREEEKIKKELIKELNAEVR